MARGAPAVAAARRFQEELDDRDRAISFTSGPSSSGKGAKSRNLERALTKGAKNRRASDVFRVKAGHMLAFDELSGKSNVAERKVMRKVIRRNISQNRGCMTLPLTIAYFALFAFAARIHEDITNVFLLQTAIRDRIVANLDDMEESIPDIWNRLETRVVPSLFTRNNSYGEPLEKEDWNRVLLYSQVQGLVSLEQTRETSQPFGKPFRGPWTGQNNLTGALLDSGEGFKPLGLEADDARRLRMVRPSMEGVMPGRAPHEADTFRILLFPSDELPDVYASLNYYRDREWLDRETEYLQVVFHILNAELGRPRLLETSVNFYFSRGGSLFYEIKMVTIFLEMWPSGSAGIQSMCVDFLWVMVLTLTSVWRFKAAWSAFLRSRFVEHLMQIYTLWEWAIICTGWGYVYGFYTQILLQQAVADGLEDVVQAQRMEPQDRGLLEERSVELHRLAGAAGAQLSLIQTNTNWYLVILMFRFFISFSSQPRLAIVVNTLRSTMTDFMHFLVVFAPTFLAYVISGNILFGRRLEEFCTIKASLASCLRIVFENEYDWDALSREHYVTTAIWVWSLLLLVVLLMLNMVLAIILDMYNDVRQHSSKSEALWETLYNYGLRFRLSKDWVRYSLLEATLDHDIKSEMVSREDLLLVHPSMPEQQLDLLFKQCTIDMEKIVADTLNKSNCLGISGSIQNTVDRVLDSVRVMNSESDDPLQGWAAAGKPGQMASLLSMSSRPADPGAPQSFLTETCKINGRSCPTLRPESPRAASAALDGLEPDEARPQWLEDISRLLQAHRKWMSFINWQLQQMQWQVHLAHVAKAPPARGAHPAGAAPPRVVL